MTLRLSPAELPRLLRALWWHRWHLGLFGAGLLLRLLTPDPLFDGDPVGYFQGAESLFDHGRYELADGSAVFWPMGYPLLLVVGFALFGVHPLTGVIVSAFASGASVALSYALARRWCSERAARLVGLLLLGSYLHWNLGSSVLADASSLFFLSLTFYAYARWSDEHRELWGAIAFLAAGAATLMRTQNGLFVPILLVLLLVRRQHALLARPLPVLGLLGALLLYLPQALYSLDAFGTLAPYLDPTIDAFRLDYAWSGGYEGRAPQAGWILFDAFLSPRLGSPLLLPFLAWGVWHWWKRARGRVLLPLFVWGLGFYLLYAFYFWYTARFAATFYLPILLPAAAGIDLAWRRLEARRSPHTSRNQSRTVIVWLLLLLLIGPVWAAGAVGVSAQRGVHLSRADAARWIAQETAPTAVAISYGEPSFDYYAERETLSLAEDFSTLAAAVNASTSAYLVVLADPARLPSPYDELYGPMTARADQLRALFGSTQLAEFESEEFGLGPFIGWAGLASFLPQEHWIVYRLGG